MYKFILGLAILITPAVLQAQGTQLASQDSLQSSTPASFFAKRPVLDVAAGFTYLQTDLTNMRGGSRTYVLGLYGIPQLHLSKHVSVLADFTNFANYHAHMTENVHGFTGGPVYGFSLKGVSVFGFAEGGAIRDSKAGVIQWNPAAVGGFGFNAKLSHHVGFQVVPGEYVATQLPNGNWQNNYTSKAGLVFTSYR